MNTDKIMIKKYFQGYVDSEWKDGYINLYRFSSCQRDFYAKEGNWFGLMSQCMAGILIKIKEFKKLAFDFCVFNSASEKNTRFDILYGKEKMEQLSFTSPKGRAEFQVNGEDVKVYFPYDQLVGVKNIEIEGEPVTRTKKIIWSFGDSITQGFDLNCPSLAYPAHLGRVFEAEVFNFGVGGYYIRKGILNDVDILQKPWIITFSYGCNDWRENQDYKKEMSEVFKALRNYCPETPIFVILPITKADEEEKKLNGTLEDVRSNIAKEAEKYPHMYVIHCGRNVNVDLHLCEDGTHPNDRGMKFLAENVQKELRIEKVT